MKNEIKIISIGEPDEDNMVNIEFEIVDEKFFKQIQAIADEEGMTINEFLESALIQYVEKLNETKKDNI